MATQGRPLYETNPQTGESTLIGYAPLPTQTSAPNIPDPYGGEGVNTSQTPATVTPTKQASQAGNATDGSVDPYDVQGSGETGRVVETPATIPDSTINTPTGYPADAYQRALDIENQRAATGVSAPPNTTPSYPNINEIDPRTGMPEGSSADYWATQNEVNAKPYGEPIYPDIQRRTEYENIMARGGGYTDPNAPALDPYGVNADAARRDAESKALQTTAQGLTVGETGGSSGNSYYGGGSGGAGGSAGTGTGGGGTGSPGVGTGGTGGGGTGTTGDDLFKDALNMRFEWNPEEDPGYNVAVKQAERQVADMMVGRGGLWSSVTQNAFSSKVFELQAYFYKEAYAMFKDDRNFTVDMARIAYGREDEAWSRNMQMLQYQANRDDEMFSRSMQQRNAALNEAKFAYQKQQDEAQLQYQQNASNLSFRAKSYDDVNKQYESMMNKWRSNGYATAEIAEFFGVAVGTPITSRTGSEAATTVATALAQEYNSIQQTAISLGKDAKFFEDLFDFEQSYSISDVTGKDITNLGSSAQASSYYKALDSIMGKIDAYIADEEPTKARTEARTQMQFLINNASAVIADMGENYFRRLIAEVDAKT